MPSLTHHFRSGIRLALFTLAILTPALCIAQSAPDPAGPKVLVVVAHADDESYFAGSVYRVAKELNGSVDQIIITNGEAGYRYSLLAERFYGEDLTQESVARAQLPEIRKREALAAGKILGIRSHCFLDEVDDRFTLDPAVALNSWNAGRVENFIRKTVERGRYDFVFTVLPRPTTHGAHQAATELALRAVADIAADRRPVVLAAEPGSKTGAIVPFAGNPAIPGSATQSSAPAFQFDRAHRFGFKDGLSYMIVVNWVIAEHKSQGMFQNDAGLYDCENFWLFETSRPTGPEAARRLFRQLSGPVTETPILTRNNHHE
jgi:N-acetylglucosamine malate deacetylase 2